MKVNSKFVDVMDPRDLHCKDYSPHCKSVSASSCRMPIQADVCKRSCGLCNGKQLPGFPKPLPLPLPSPIPLPHPLPLRGKRLHT